MENLCGRLFFSAAHHCSVCVCVCVCVCVSVCETQMFRAKNGFSSDLLDPTSS